MAGFMDDEQQDSEDEYTNYCQNCVYHAANYCTFIVGHLKKAFLCIY